MAISPRMLAVLQKVDALREAHFAKLRERGKQEADVKARAKAALEGRNCATAVFTICSCVEVRS